jgi:hypothetical protein
MIDKEKQKAIIAEAIEAARQIQDYLWGEKNEHIGVEERLRMLRKRIAKLEDIKRENPHCVVEFKKRLLQTAAVAIAWLERIEERGVEWDGDGTVPTNLPQYDQPIKD